MHLAIAIPAGKKMTRTITAGLTLCGALLVWVVRSTPNQIAANAESTSLIKSIQGPALYTAYCAVCHGKDARGAGPMAMSLRAKTPDLTRIAARNRGTFPLTRVQRIISGEEPAETGHGPREMPGAECLGHAIHLGSSYREGQPKTLPLCIRYRR